jgi:cobalt-zinc-cadmium efflux system membrane fusion protein
MKISALNPVTTLALGTALAITGCGGAENNAAEKMTSYSSANAVKAELFTVPADQMQHVQVVAVEPTKLQRVLRLTGAVAFNSFKTTPIISLIGGPVSRILVAPGEHVKQGQVLLQVSSPDFSLQRATYLKARSAFHVADKNYDRAKDLYEHHAIAERDLLQAESDRSQAEADLQSSEQSLKILGISNPESLLTGPPSAEIPLLAPLGGEIVERLCSPGQLIAAGATQCFTISDVSTVWVLVNVYQNDLAYVHTGDTATIQTDAYPDAFHGKISYIAPALDPNTRTLQARIVTDNPGGKLKKDMYVSAVVAAGDFQNALAVPDAAILRDSENLPFVYLVQGTNQFARRKVQIGESQGGRTQILSGLAAGDRVAGDGSLFLQFANQLQQANQ